MTNEHTEASMTQELRKLAEAVAGKYDQMKHTTEENMARARAFQVFSFAAANPSAILELLDRLDKAEKDAERYRWLRDKADYLRPPEGSPQVLITDEFGEPISLGRDAYPQGNELDAAIDAAMEASK